MEYGFLGNSGLKVSELCLGAMTLGREVTEDESHQMLGRFVEAGGNFIDTANVYSRGRSEEVVGRWLSGKKRDDFVIATKVRHAMGDGPNDLGLSRKHVLASVDASLRRLRTDYIDLYQVHAWDDITPLPETLSTLNGLVQSGKVRYLGVSNYSGWQLQKAIDFSLEIPEAPAKIIAIAGESGSGKTTLANLVLGLISPSSGQILYQGQDVAGLSAQQRTEYTRQVQVVFQDPYAVYDPFYRVKHIFDIVISNFKLARNRDEARTLVEDALKMVGMRGEEVLEKYPHQLSGGQRQRMTVARAYLLRPRLIVADEPVSMVDASLRAMILDIMLRLRDKQNISFLYITHDLSTAYQVCDDIYLLYQGSIAEKGDTAQVIEHPKHPYVQMLIDSIPVPDPEQKWGTDLVLPDEETLRSQIDSGCRYYPRCPYHMDRCLVKQPPLYQIDGAAHQAACYLYDDQQRKE